MNRPALLIFDSDGVLLDSELVACRVVAEELREWGLDFYGRSVAERFAGYTDAAIARTVTEETGMRLPEDFPARVQARALRAFETELRPVQGMEALLKRDSGPRCVASNAAQHRLERALELVGLAGYFPPGALFSAEQVARAKPAPDLHLHAAKVMGFQPADCLVIEDSVTGVQGARAAGMRCAGLVAASHAPEGQTGLLAEAGAEPVFTSVADLSNWLHG